MTRHFGVLIPSTNTTVETEFSHLLPADIIQAHYARVMSRSPDKSPFHPPRAEDVAYQSKMLGTAKVETVILLQSSASLFDDDFDEKTLAAIKENAAVQGIISCNAVAQAARHLGATNVALVSPYSEAVTASAKRYFEARGLKIAAAEGFAATDSYAIGALGPENARDAFARINRPEIEAFLVPGGNFPTMRSIAGWEAEFGKPVIATNTAAVWAMMQLLGIRDRLSGLGRLLG